MRDASRDKYRTFSKFAPSKIGVNILAAQRDFYRIAETFYEVRIVEIGGPIK